MSDSKPHQARDVYRVGVEYLISKGARREELGSGWWYCDAMPSEMGFGDAIDFFLQQEGLDLRQAVPGEPDREYWEVGSERGTEAARMVG